MRQPNQEPNAIYIVVVVVVVSVCWTFGHTRMTEQYKVIGERLKERLPHASPASQQTVQIEHNTESSDADGAGEAMASLHNDDLV